VVRIDGVGAVGHEVSGGGDDTIEATDPQLSLRVADYKVHSAGGTTRRVEAADTAVGQRHQRQTDQLAVVLACRHTVRRHTAIACTDTCLHESASSAECRN
jgi:hypothetical protein